MKKPYPYLFFLFFFSIASQCKKSNISDNPYGLPNASSSGFNTFGYLLNGKAFIAYDDVFHLGASYKNDSLYLGGGPKMGSYLQNLNFLLKGKIVQGQSYLINNNNIMGTLITDSTCQGIQFTIFQFSAVSGLLQLSKLDTLKKIVSGTFDCIIPVPGCDTIKISYGRFDITYH